MKHEDEACYHFHEKDRPDRCFLCLGDGRRLIIVRQQEEMVLVHLCQDCLLGNRDDYLLDNTRPWTGDG